MSAAAAPTIPPRPVRAQNRVPEVPPRPLPKRLESPSRNPYPSSPFNEPLSRTRSTEPTEASAPARPPSVVLPSIGQEGSEYADLQYEDTAPLSQSISNSSAQTRLIGGNLPMHAPKPSLPISSAKAQVQAVTRTDSSQAAAHGIGKPLNEDGETLTRLKSKSSFSRPGSAASSMDRRTSVQFDDEHGPAELGIRVPINPYLGDVQAPSPAPDSAAQGLVNYMGVPKKHHRTKSGRDVFLPPGSYGLHGHGAVGSDKFEKDWYAKHPEALQRAKEDGYYHGIGSGRGESALSSEELNKLVRETPSRGAGSSAGNTVTAYPDEQIGYLASDQISSRVASPQTTGGLYKLNSNSSQLTAESPLRKTSFPADITGKEEFQKTNRKASGGSDRVIENESEHDEGIHVDEPTSSHSKAAPGYGSESDYVGVNGSSEAEAENGYGTPILASDEVAKENGDYMQAAVPPNRERRGSSYEEHTPHSRPNSRPGSIHGMSGLSRFVSRPDEIEQPHTPLEDVEEYEPLFPEDENKPITAADRLKLRPDALKHRFPSQDIWEDAPSSQYHVATVSTPDLPAQTSASTFETPAQEAARKGETPQAESSKEVAQDEQATKSSIPSHLRNELPTRPGLANRFPSQDIWEDSPDSSHLVTTVSTPPAEEAKSPVDTASKPAIPPRPVKQSKVGETATEPSASIVQPTIPSRPPKRLHQVPPADAQLTSTERQVSPIENKKAPVIPERPKPQVPTRPARKESSDSLTKTTSAGSAGSAVSDEGVKSAPAVKAKPAVPARPVGNKIASLRAGFLSDLNQRLQLGPQGPPPKEKEPEPEQETEKAPLSDARKGRAKGPQRRKPAVSPSGGAEAKAPSFQIFAPQSVWQISNEDHSLTVHSHGGTESSKAVDIPVKEEAKSEATEVPEVQTKPAATEIPKVVEPKPEVAEVPKLVLPEATEVPKIVEPTEEESSKVPSTFAPPLAVNTAGESTDPVPSSDATPKSEKTDPIDKVISATANPTKVANTEANEVEAAKVEPTAAE